MKRRLLDLCLLAYPRARRERDRNYLRDLALDLSETYGLLPQALSLLRGGLRERIEVRRRRPGSSLGTWIKQVVVACFTLAALAFAASSLIGPAEGDGERVELERLTCLHRDHPPNKRNHARVNGASECAQAKRLIAARMRGGWDCTTRRRARSGQRAIAWRCTRGQELVAWRAL
jgi:hypothetical protein